MQPEGLFERGRERRRRARDVERDRAELLELAASPPVQVASLGGCPRPVDRIPAVVEVEHGRLGAQDELESVARRGGQPALGGQAEELREVRAGRGRAIGEERGGRRIRPVGHEHVHKRGRVLAQHARDAHAEPALGEQRQRAAEPAVLVGDVHAQLPARP